MNQTEEERRAYEEAREEEFLVNAEWEDSVREGLSVVTDALMTPKKAAAIFSSSKTDDWETPRWLFDTYDKMWDFGVDVAASHNNNKCPVYFTKEDDALNNSWSDLLGSAGAQPSQDQAAWCNPPYGRAVGKWVAKCVEESAVRPVGMLIYARTDTAYFHDLILPNAYEIHFIRRRLRFRGSDGTNGPATAPSMLVFFCGYTYRRPIFYSVEKGQTPQPIGRSPWQ